MAIYLVLNQFTDQGIRNIKDTTKRAETVREMAKKFGITTKEIYWTLGSYDIVDIFDAPDEASMAALLASIGAAGNVRTVAIRAFSEADMNGILTRLG